MAQTIGERLREAREEQGLSLGDVAHATRIHANTLEGLEADDYSSFASTAYAKSFLNLYARHLGVDASDALSQFSTGANAPVVGGAHFIRSVAEAIEPVEHAGGIGGRSGSNYAEAPRPVRRASGGAPPLVLGTFLLLLLLVIPVLYIAGKDASSPEDAWGNLTRLFAGGDDAETEEAGEDGQAASDPAVTDGAPTSLNPRPGTRVAPAAPPRRPAAPSSPSPSPVIDSRDVSGPIAQVTPPTPSPVATPGPAPTGPTRPPAAVKPTPTPIKARPIVATPVVLPTPDEAGSESGAGADGGDGAAVPDGDNESGSEPSGGESTPVD